VRRINRHDLARDQLVEQHTDAGEMLFDRPRLHVTAELLYIWSDLDRLDFIKSANPVRFAPVEKVRERRGGRPRACWDCGC
jgi:hypothetical protein